MKCARFLWKPDLKSFSTKSLRQGCAAAHTAVLKETLAALNPEHGRAKHSVVDLATYTPPNVVVKPGPLYGDVEQCKIALDSALRSYHQNMKSTLLCSFCGFPQCTCEKCKRLNGQASGSRQVKHTCWLEASNGRAGRRPTRSISVPSDVQDSMVEKLMYKYLVRKLLPACPPAKQRRQT